MRTSDSIKELSAALAKFQMEVKNPKNSAKNPQFSSQYAPLDEILELVRPSLGKFGLSIVQDTGGALEDITIATRLLHESGEWMESEPLHFKGEQTLKGGGTKLSVQGAGSAITYGRRYQLTAILGLAGNDDDDGNTANESRKNGKQQSDDTEDDSEDVRNKKIDDLKVKTLKGRLETAGMDEGKFLDFYHVDKLENITNEIYVRGMNALEKRIAEKAKKEKKPEPPEEKLNI